MSPPIVTKSGRNWRPLSVSNPMADGDSNPPARWPQEFQEQGIEDVKYSKYEAASGDNVQNPRMRQPGMICMALIACAVSASTPLLAAESQPAHASTITASQDEFLGRFMDYYARWAEGVEGRGQATGEPLNRDQSRLASEIGIKHPEKVRLVFVDEVPFPTENPEIRAAGEKFGFIGPGIINNAQAFGYTIWVRKGFSLDRPRLAHELVHVMQIERSGNFTAYARQYVLELMQFGHEKSPLELEAYDANRKYAG